MTISNINPGIRIMIVVLLPILIIAALGWANLQFARQNPGGNDFLVYYTGTRALLLEGISPYSNEVANRIQTSAYGRPAQAGEHELGYAYPLYANLFFFSPFGVIGDYDAARAAWMTVLELALLMMAFLTLRIAVWEPPIWLTTIYFLFSLLWYNAVRGVINGNAVIVVALFITLFLFSMKNSQYRAAGIFLALSTIKPHLVLLLVIFVLLWSISSKEWEILAWFGLTMAVLIGGAMIVIPNWILQNLWEIFRFPTYNPILSLGELLTRWMPGIGSQLQWGIVIVFGLLLVFEWTQARDKGFPRFYWTAGLTLTLTQWIGIPTDPGNFIILFPVLGIILAAWEKRWKNFGNLVVSGVLLFLFLGLWGLFLSTVEYRYQPVQNPIMFLPLPAFLLLGLYWIRWWISKPVLNSHN